MDHEIIGNVKFTDGIARLVHLDGDRRYVFNPDGKPVYGLWIIPAELATDTPIIVNAEK